MEDNPLLIQQAIAELNQIGKNFGKQTKTEYLKAIRKQRFSDRQRKPDEDILRGRIGLKFQYAGGQVVRVRWRFARHGIMQEHGVGKYRKKGSGKEKPRVWIVPTLDLVTPQLANDLQRASLKSLAPVVQLKIPGLFSIELKTT